MRLDVMAICRITRHSLAAERPSRPASDQFRSLAKLSPSCVRLNHRAEVGAALVSIFLFLDHRTSDVCSLSSCKRLRAVPLTALYFLADCLVFLVPHRNYDPSGELAISPCAS